MASEKLGPFLNIDRFLGKAKDRVNMVGVELEGGWIKLPPDRKAVDHDGSVFRPGFNPVDFEITSKLRYSGEIPLPPLAIREFPSVMKVNYPAYVDASCGMHVHLSTKHAFAYQRLMVNKPFSYPGTIVEYMKRWAASQKLPKAHPIWERLAGNNEYCQHLFHADEQAKKADKGFNHHGDGHRYTVISYCWGRLKTLECRLLPMMTTADQGVAAVQEIINITNAFLAASKEKEPRLKSTVSSSGEDDEVIVERRIYA